MKKVVVSLVTLALVLSLLPIVSSAATTTCPAQTTSTTACPATTTAQCTSTATSACCCPCPVVCCPVVTPCPAAACCVQTAACTSVVVVSEEKEHHANFEHPETVIENMHKEKSSPSFEGNTGKNVGISVNVKANFDQANTASMTQTSGDTIANTVIDQSATGGAATGGNGGDASVGGDGTAIGGSGDNSGGSASNSASAETNALGPTQTMDMDQVNTAGINVVNNF